MIIEKHLPSSLNADIDERYLKPNEALALQNCRMGTSPDGKDMRIENIPSTLLIENPLLPAGDNTCVGSVADPVKRRIIYFNVNSNPNSNAIYVYYIRENKFYLVISDSQVTEGLVFDTNSPINREAILTGELLFWTNNSSDPKCINIESAIKANDNTYVTDAKPYIFPLDGTNITLIKEPPVYPLIATSVSDPEFENYYFTDSFFQFTYYYEFYDGQKSALAPYSMPIAYPSLSFNAIDIALPTRESNYISQDVVRINIIAKFGNAGQSTIIKVYDRNNTDDATEITDYNANPDTQTIVYRFYNNENIGILDDITANNPFDNVPLKTKTIELAGNRLFPGNNLLGYDAPASTSLMLNTYAAVNDDNIYFKSGSRYIAGVKFFDKYRRTSGINKRIAIDIPDFVFSNLDPINTTTGISTTSSAISESAGIWFRTPENAVLTGRHHTSDENGNTTYTYATVYNGSSIRIVPDVRTESNSIGEEGSYFLCPLNTVMTGRYHHGDEQGNTIYEYATLKAIDEDGNTISSLKITVEDIQWSSLFAEDSGTNYIVPANTVMVGRQHYSDETGNTRYAYASVKIYNQETTNDNNIGFELSNTNAAAEIPAWAYYMQIAISKNQTKENFIQGWFYSSSYASKNNDNTYQYNKQSYDPATMKAIAIDISPLLFNGLGYAFDASSGDICSLYLKNGQVFSLPIIGQDGNYILLSPKDIGLLASGYDFTVNPMTTGSDTPFNLTLNTYFNNDGYYAQSNLSPMAGDVPSSSNSNLVVTDNLAHTFYFIFNNIKLQFSESQSGKSFTIRIKLHTDSYTNLDIFTQSNIVAGQVYEFSQTVSLLVPAYSGDAQVMIYYEDSGGVTGTISILGGSITIVEQNNYNYFEIYTPYKSSGDQEPLYECSDVYDIENPGTDTRQYPTDITSQFTRIVGDTYLVSRQTMNAYTLYEAMSPDDKYWQTWNRNLGWPSFYDNIGQQRLTNSIVYSDTFVQGTKVNGLNKFQATAMQSIDSRCGEIQSLYLVNKIAQQQGSVMLCICQNEPLSIYLGETQLVSQTDNAFVAQSNGVIGTINPLSGNYGTMHPESVVGFLGEAFWFDIQHGCWVRYSANGAQKITSNLVSFFEKFQQRYEEQNLSLRIISCIDALRGDLICCMPGIEDESYIPDLPSYDSLPDYMTTKKSQFELYDGQQKMMFFDPDNDIWKYTIGVIPEWTDYINKQTYGFLNGKIFLFEGDSTFNSFFGQQTPARIGIVANSDPNTDKDLFSISVEGNTIPDYTVAYTKYPNEQITDLAAGDKDMNGRNVWQTINGIQYASFLKDRLSPNVEGTPEQKMYAGDYIRSVATRIMLEFQKYDERLIIHFINIGHQEVAGHNVKIKK